MSRVPRIRFKGFEEDWEQRKLGEVVEIYDGVHQTPNYTDNGIMFLSVENITKLKSSKFISEEAFKRDYKFYPQENDILMTRIGDVGTTNVVTDNSLKAYYVSLALLKYKSTNPFFLSSAIQSDFVQSGLANRTLKTAIPIKINKDEIGKVNVMLPLLKDEQELIGYCFHNLDHLITLHQRKLKKLKNIKKSMLENLFPKNGEKTPRIRFSGFTEDWEQRKLGEIFIYLRNNTLSREELNDEYGVAQSIHYGDVLIKYGECLNVSNELLPFINQQYIVDKFKKCYIQNGDIIIADTAEDETVGKCTEISGIVNQNIILGLHTIPLRPVNKFANGYLGFYLNSNSYHKQLKPLMQGIKVISISKNSLKTTVLEYPSEINEQQKIGTCFQSLDHLITLHQSKLEKLRKIKKSMLESMFV